MPHFGAPAVDAPSLLLALRQNNAASAELLANISKVAFTVKLTIGQHHPMAATWLAASTKARSLAQSFQGPRHRSRTCSEMKRFQIT